MHHHSRPPARGFTLIELAIVLAVAAILMRVATPGMGRAVAQRAMAAQSSEFMSALRFARSEAIKRGAVVTLCAADASAPGQRCQPRRSAADWRGGWIVFMNPGSRGVLGQGDPVLRVQQPLVRSGGVTGTRSSVSFTAAGFSTDASSNYVFEAPAAAVTDTPPPLRVCVSKQGRPRLAAAGVCD